MTPAHGRCRIRRPLSRETEYDRPARSLARGLPVPSAPAARNPAPLRALRGNLRKLLELACGRTCALSFTGHQHQRKSGPGKHQVDPPPQPDRLVEEFQGHLVDIDSAEQLAVNPPGRRSNLIQAVHALYLKSRAGEQLCQLFALEAALV